MLHTKPTCTLFLIDGDVRYLWLTFSHCADFCTVYTQNTVATRSGVVNSDKIFRCARFTLENNTYQPRMGFILDITRTCRWHIHTEEKLDEIGAKWEITPRKSSVLFVLYTELVCWRHHHKMQQDYCSCTRVLQMWFTNWWLISRNNTSLCKLVLYLHGVYARHIQPTNALHRYKDWFNLSFYANN
jgi:hypothetical protein